MSTLSVGSITGISSISANDYTFSNSISVGNSSVNSTINATAMKVGGNTLTIGTGTYFVANGNVGIGTSSPGSALHVSGTAIGNGNGGNGVHIGVQSGYATIEMLGTNATGSLIDFSVANVDYNARIIHYNSNNHLHIEYANGHRLNFGNNGSISTTANNFGIGNSTPTEKLVVDGAIRITGNNVYFKTTGNPGKGSKIFLAGADDTGNQWIGAGQNTAYWMEYSGDPNEGHVFRTGAVERMIISGSNSNAKIPANSISLNPSSAGYVLTPNQPAFYAWLNTSTSTFSADTSFVYNAVRFNIGSNYNTSTGRFTAPVAGIYLFTATIMNDPDGAIEGKFFYFTRNGSRIDGRDIVESELSSQVTHYEQHASWIAQLSAGDYVDIRSSASVTFNNGQDGPSYRNQFSGRLLG